MDSTSAAASITNVGEVNHSAILASISDHNSFESGPALDKLPSDQGEIITSPTPQARVISLEQSTTPGTSNKGQGHTHRLEDGLGKSSELDSDERTSTPSLLHSSSALDGVVGGSDVPAPPTSTLVSASTSAPASLPMSPSTNDAPSVGPSLGATETPATNTSTIMPPTSPTQHKHQPPLLPPLTPRRHKIKSNPHPYPIVTTSTGNLSRSNTLRTSKNYMDALEYEGIGGSAKKLSESTHHNGSEEKRRSIDSSNGQDAKSAYNTLKVGDDNHAGSSDNPNNGTRKISGRHRHRYNRSLTDEPPRPLPIPPHWSGNGNGSSGGVPSQSHMRPQGKERPRTRSGVNQPTIPQMQIAQLAPLPSHPAPQPPSELGHLSLMHTGASSSSSASSSTTLTGGSNPSINHDRNTPHADFTASISNNNNSKSTNASGNGDDLASSSAASPGMTLDAVVPSGMVAGADANGVPDESSISSTTPSVPMPMPQPQPHRPPPLHPASSLYYHGHGALSPEQQPPQFQLHRTLPTPVPTPPLPEQFPASRVLQAHGQEGQPLALALVPGDGQVYHINGQSFTIQTIKPLHTGSSVGSEGRGTVSSLGDDEERIQYASASLRRSPLLRPTSSSTAGAEAATAKLPIQMAFPPTPTTPLSAPPTSILVPASFMGPVRHQPGIEDERLVSTNPKEWSSEDLLAYLSRILRSPTGARPTDGDHNRMVPVQDHDDHEGTGESSELRNVLAFVRERGINGKVFLRLDEGDLERYGISSPLWRAALLNASRVLRKNVVQEQVMMGFNEDYFFHDGKNGDHQPGLAESPTEMAMLPTPSPEFDGGFGEQVYQKEEDKGRVAPSSLAFLRSPRHDPNIAVMRSGDEGEGEGRDVDAWGGGDVSGASMKVEELMMDRHVVEHSTRREVDDGGDGVHVPFEPAPQKAHPAEPGQEAELGQDRHLEWDRLDYGYPRKSLSEMSEGSSSSFLSSSSSSSLSIRSASPTQDSNMALSKSTSPTRNKLARSQSERHPRRSPRHQRPDRSGVVRHKSGRVKGMVESFEKNASFDELMESPTKAGLSRSQSLLTHANHHRNRSSTSSVSSSVSSGIGSGSLSRSNSAAHRHHSRHSQETTRHHFHELIAPSIVGGAGAKVEGYINRARSGSTSSNTSASGDEYGWKNAHSYTLVAKKESRPLPIPPSWASTSTDSSSRDSGSSGGVVRNGVGSVNSSPVKGSHWVQNDRRNSQQDSAGMGVSVEQDSIFQRPLPQPPTWAGGNANGTAIEIATIKPVKSHPSGNVYSTTTASASASDVFETATEGDLSEFGYGPRLSVGGSRGSDQIKERAGQRDDLERRWEGDSRVDADDPAHATVKRVGGAIGANGSAASAGLVLVLEQQQHPQNTQPESLFVTPNGDPSDTQSAAQRYEEARSSPTLAHYENHHEQHRHGEQQPADRQLPNGLTAEAQLGVVQQPVPRHHNPSGHLHSRSLPVPPVSVQQESNTKRDDEEELTMEELLAQVVDDAYSTGPAKETRPAGSGDSGSGGLVGMGAGAAAWELADVKKGNTVKRVPGTEANVTQPPVERKKTPSTAVTLKDGEPPFIVAPSLPAGLGHERKSSIQFAKDQSASPVEGPEETEEEERGRAAIRGRVKKGGSLKEAGKEKRVGLNEIFANPDLADRRSPHLEKTRARERDREDHKEIGERPDRYRHGKKMSASEKQFMEDLAKATEELEKEKERRERAEVEQVGQTRQVKEGEDEEIKRLREEMEQTRKMVEAIQLRVEEVERKVAELEALEKQREQSNTVSREIEPSTEDEPEEELSEESVDKQQSAPSSRWSGLLSNPRTVVRRMLGLQKETNGHGKFPRGEPSNISGIPSYVFLVGIGVCAVVLKVVLKRALVKGVAGR